MISHNLLQRIVKKESVVVPTLFKSVQFNIIKKLDSNKKLTENEKRYLRGKMRQKMITLQELMCEDILQHDEFMVLLNNIGSYYITGLEALKHNGYGWYYEPKIIEVINTKIAGMICFGARKIKFIRVKSIINSKIIIDKETRLNYATNEQIIKDVVFTKNDYAKIAWMQMFKRYGRMFAHAKNIRKIDSEQKIDYSKYGV